MTLFEQSLNAWLKGRDHPCKLRIASRLLSSLNGPVETLHDGMKLVVSPRDLIGKYILLHGGFEQETLQVAREVMAGGGTFVDLGANVGLFSIAVSENKSTLCVAIEPQFETFGLLQKNIALNSRGNVVAVNCAVSSGPKLIPMQQFYAGNAGTNRPLSSYPASAAAPSTTWNAALDLMCILSTLKVDAIMCLKIDLEGYEFEAMKKFDFGSRLRPKCIISEFMSCPDPYEGKSHIDFHRFVVEKGYRAFDVLGRPLTDVDASTVPIEHNIIYRDLL